MIQAPAVVQACTLPLDLKQEILDVCCASVEKYPPSELERCCQVGQLLNAFFGGIQCRGGCSQAVNAACYCMQSVKEILDKKYGPSWSVVTGKSFSFEVTHAVSI